ncbi:MAG: PadR family transcriptional regulator [Sphingomonas sp.]|nr:PadR family transcriptional regulator [Sphingomonas sp.]
MGGRRGSRRWGGFEVSWEAGPDTVGARVRRRVFDGGELRLVLLKLIADQPRHGYDLIREIEELTAGAYAPSPGIVYPTLTLLDDMGLIEEQQSEGAKKQFAATEAGRAHLAERAEEVAALIARLTELGSERTRTESASVRRAMANLRHVLMHQLRAGDVPTEKLHAIVALIDEAAQKIERLD